MEVADRVTREGERHERVGEAAIELARGQNADDGVRLAIQDQLPADDRRVPPNSDARSALGQHDHAVAARLVFARHERAPERRPHPEDVEVGSAHHGEPQLPRLAAAR